MNSTQKMAASAEVYRKLTKAMTTAQRVRYAVLCALETLARQRKVRFDLSARVFFTETGEPWAREYRAWAEAWLSGDDLSRETTVRLAWASAMTAWEAAMVAFDRAEHGEPAWAEQAAWAGAAAAGAAWAAAEIPQMMDMSAAEQAMGVKAALRAVAAQAVRATEWAATATMYAMAAAASKPLDLVALARLAVEEESDQGG